MSAPQIPNLNTLRRGGLRRGYGRTTREGAGRKSNDEIVQETDNDAAGSRLSAIDANYLDDPFAAHLTSITLQRRLPLMNRGTYVRTTGLDRIVDTFLASIPGRKQIISLGAGSDTRYFRLKRKHSNLELSYHEIDFEVNTTKKIEQLQSPAFATVADTLCAVNINDFEVVGGNLSSKEYRIHAQDLRQLPDTLPGLDFTLATLIISECCLIYLSPAEAQNVLAYFADKFNSVPMSVAIYEPIRPGDAFGRTMVRNLVTRGIQLQTLEMYADLHQQRARLQEHQFLSRAEDIDFVWRSWIDASEKERIEGLEWMDEVEEFVLLAKHYCIAWGWRGWEDDSKWRNLPTSYPSVNSQATT